MSKKLSYVTSPGTLKSMLERIKEASLPERFTQDFVETKLRMKGGTARSLIPFIKKMGLVSSDGIPTDQYREFRNKLRSGVVIARSMKLIFAELFEMNEYANELSDKELLGLIVQITGGDEKSAVTKYTLSTFKILKEQADFDGKIDLVEKEIESQEKPKTPPLQDNIVQQLFQMQQSNIRKEDGINLSYTINLNLPATTNIEVFNAIFKSLKEHLINQ